MIIKVLAKKTLSLLLILGSVVAGIGAVELFCRLLISYNASADRALRRVVFFEGEGTILENHGDIFTYLPHEEIRNLTGFVDDATFKPEYDYRFRTNNFGLVQDSDLVPERESFLLLGDSFTEGQGAEPWFRLLSREIDRLGYQPINGGLMGTGFQQWIKLSEYLTAANIRIRKALVLFISLDYNRVVWNFTSNDLNCLATLTDCRIEDSYFYRLPPVDELPSWITKISVARANAMRSQASAIRKGWLAAHAVALLPATYRLYIYFRSRLAERQSRASIPRLIHMYGPENIAFMHLPQQDEIENQEPIDLGLQARRSIQESGGKLFDGFKLCRLATTDYYTGEGHPNRDGYAKITACVIDVIKSMTAMRQ
jgi:hypothetical protein